MATTGAELTLRRACDTVCKVLDRPARLLEDRARNGVSAVPAKHQQECVLSSDAFGPLAKQRNSRRICTRGKRLDEDLQQKQILVPVPWRGCGEQQKGEREGGLRDPGSHWPESVRAHSSAHDRWRGETPMHSFLRKKAT